MTGRAARGWGVAGFGAGAILLGILLARIFQQPLQPYRTAKVPFIHHGIRLRGLDAVQELGSWNPLEIYALLDRPYPPGLHFVGFAWGALFGLDAESVTPSALLWLVLLAVCVGVSARRLGGSKQASVAAGLFTALLPCVHGSATIYYFDLPYLSLVWLAVLCVLPQPGARPIAQGLRSGLAFVAACTAKWTALPLGSPFLIGALLCGSRQARRQRLLASAAVAVTVGILLALVLGSSDGSLRGTFETQADTSGHQDSIFGLRSKPSDLVPRAAYMAIHFVSAGLSPALAVPLLFLAVLWLLRDRRGLPLVAMAGLASLVFVGLIAADEDERLIVPATTLVSLCAGLGLDSIRSPQRARRVAAGIVALGLLVALDFHHSPRAPWNTEIVLFRPNHPAMDPARLRGLGAVSSVEGMGWNRRDETTDVPDDFLAALGRAFEGDRSQDVLVTVAAEDLGVHSVWFEYQHLLAFHRGERQRSDTFARTVLPCETQDHNARQLLIVTGEAFPTCLERTHWQKDRLIEGNSLSLTLFLRTPPEP